MNRRPPLRGDELPAIVAAPPGPRSVAAARRLRRAEGAAIWGTADTPIVWARAKGSVVEDLDGNRYLDFTSGFGAASLGHAAPEVTRAVAAQARRMTQGLGDLQPNAAREKLIRRLAALGGGLSRVLLASTGSEAVELALKTAALVTGRRRVVAFEGGYHGQLGAALEVTHAPASPTLTLPGGPPRAMHIPFPRSGRCAARTACRDGACDLTCFEEAWEGVTRACAGPDPPGAVIVEPIQGRAGVIVPPQEFLPRLCERARALGMLVIYDEILTGAGRTGPLGAWERCGTAAEPDLLTAGKGLGGGVAIAALLGRPKIMEVWAKHAPSSGEAPYASTYYAHPLACAGALAALRVLTGESPPFGLAGAFAADLAEACRGSEAQVIVRGEGSLAGIEFVGDAGSEDSGAARARRAESWLRSEGILVVPGGRHGSVLTFLPARSLTQAQRSLALERVRSAVASASAP